MISESGRSKTEQRPLSTVNCRFPDPLNVFIKIDYFLTGNEPRYVMLSSLEELTIIIDGNIVTRLGHFIFFLNFSRKKKIVKK